MTTPKNARTARGGGRFYSWRNESFWSVTTIVNGGMPKPTLVYWSANEVAGFTCDNIDEIAALLAKGERDAAFDLLKRAPWRKRDKAADLGSLVHAWIEADRLGKPMPKVSDQVEPFAVAFQQFVDDFNPEYEATEASVYNRAQSYAGTLDAIVTLQLPLTEGPRRFILDAKTGKDIYPEVGLQLAAYRNAEFIGLPDGTEAPMPVVDGGLALHLTPEGYRLIEVDVSDQVFKAFLYAREVYRFCLETSKSVLGLEYGNQARIKEAVP